MNGNGNAASRVAYLNARLLDPASGLDGTGALLADGPRIADFGPRLFNEGVPEGVAAIDCGGRCLAPGLVDMRVQLREPGEEHKETIVSASRAAAAGGVTSMAALPNTDPVVDDVAGVEFVARRAREAKLVKIYTYGALTRGLEGKEITELGLLSSYGAVGFTDGIKAVANAQVMRRALDYARTFDLVITQHPEEPRLARGAMNEGELATRLGLAGIPAAAEVIMVERDLRLVELTGGRYHVANVSTAAAVEVIRAAKLRGLRVTCDTAPHYFTLNENAVGDYRTFAKVSPPLRGEDDRQAVAEVMMIERDLRLVAQTGGRYHAAHVSTAAAVEAIRQAKQRGLDVTCDTAPHYFALNEIAVGDYRTFAKVRPPLRAEADREAIVEGLKDGTIDAVASDHSPHDQDSKRLPFAQAAFGIIGLETLLPLTLELYHNKHLSLPQALALLTCRPAERLGLGAGRLAKGAPADLVVIDTDRPWKVDEAGFRSKSKNSPFDGRPVQGHALRTVVDGRAIFGAEGTSGSR